MSAFRAAACGHGNAVKRGAWHQCRGRFGRSSRQSTSPILILATDGSSFYVFGLNPSRPYQDERPDRLHTPAWQRLPIYHVVLQGLLHSIHISVKATYLMVEPTSMEKVL